jgi:large subunit ribosomal protein L18
MSGTAETPRVCIFKSSKYIYAQAIDDAAGTTLAAASSQEPSVRESLKTSGTHIKAAEQIGGLMAERLKAKGVEKIVFDRSGYRFHGRIKAFAEGARKNGLQF